MSKHTPGPWKWTVYKDDELKWECVSSLDSNEGQGVLFHSAAWPVQEANARLIATAPDLLEAAGALLALTVETSKLRMVGLDTTKLTMANLRLAKVIARAEEEV